MQVKTCVAADLKRKSKFERKRENTICLWLASFVCVIYDAVKFYSSTIIRFIGEGSLIVTLFRDSDNGIQVLFFDKSCELLYALPFPARVIIFVS